MVFVVRTAENSMVVRMREGEGVPHEYVKERWCLEQAAAHGIPGPTVLALGTAEGFGYMLETFVPGVSGEDSPGERLHLWRALGRYARIIHAIPVTGFGLDLADPQQGRFSQSFSPTWQAHIGYNIESLTENDALITLGVLTTAQSRQVRAIFEDLRGHSFTFGLNHGDLLLKNTLVDASGQVSLLDWGSAAVHIVPHSDLIEILQCQWETSNPPEGALPAFLEGYGLSPAAYAAMRPDLNSLLLLRAIDTTRWAIDNKPSRIPAYAAHARQAVRRTLQQSESIFGWGGHP